MSKSGNGEFKIEKGIPIPEAKGGRNRRYPFGEMGVGDSFFIPDVVRDQVAPAASYWGIRHPGQKFSLRKVDGGIRVWRVA